MRTYEFTNGSKKPNPAHPFVKTAILLAGLFVLAALLYLVYAGLATAGLKDPIVRVIKWALSIDSVQIWWFVTRAAGFVAYFLLWLSTAWGLAVSSKIFDPLIQRDYTYDFHQYLSLFAIGFLFLHVVVLLLDHYAPFSLLQVLIPFTSTYRPVWVGIGVISFYLILLVTVTFYMRKRIGSRAFRVIHVLSLVGYLGATFHAIYAGTDSVLPMAQYMYKGSLLSIVFLTSFWLIALIQGKLRKPAQLRKKA